MRFVILRHLTHSELGMFYEYRRQGLEGSKQRAINMDGPVVDRVFPGYRDNEKIPLRCRYLEQEDDVREVEQFITRQERNWRLEGNCPRSTYYEFVRPGCLFAMVVEADRRPATAGWVVMAPEHPCSVAIHNCADSGELASEAMIAIDINEHYEILNILQEHFANVFPIEAAMSQSQVPKDQSEELAPDPVGLWEIIKSVGHTLGSAIADLVDNSISAGAKNIQILFPNPNDEGGRRLAIIDDGDGMDEERLKKAMKVAGRRQYEEDDLGRYGFGLKGAAFSQGKRLVVATRTKVDPSYRYLMWDRDVLEENQSWVPQQGPLTTWEKQIASFEGAGTAVLISKMRTVTDVKAMATLSQHQSEEIAIRDHLELVFHRFLEGKAEGRPKLIIKLNGTVLTPTNPVTDLRGNLISILNQPKQIPVNYSNEDGTSGNSIIHVQGYVIPNKADLEEQFLATNDRHYDPKRWATSRNFHDSQGIFYYRQDRLIRFGGWPDRGVEPHLSYARVVFDFDRVLDEYLRVTVHKADIKPSAFVIEEMRDLLENIRKEARRVYSDGKKTKSKLKSIPTPLPVPPSPPGPAAPGPGLPTPSVPTFPTIGGPTSPPLTSGPYISTGSLKTELKVVDSLPDGRPWQINESFHGGEKVQISRDTAPALAELAEAIEVEDRQRSRSALGALLKGLDAVKLSSAFLASEKKA